MACVTAVEWPLKGYVRGPARPFDIYRLLGKQSEGKGTEGEREGGRERGRQRGRERERITEQTFLRQ